MIKKLLRQIVTNFTKLSDFLIAKHNPKEISFCVGVHSLADKRVRFGYTE